MTETDETRRDRHRKRATFDGVAELYDEVRVGYPDEVVDWVLSTAGISEGGRVLEIGCGTGQLTRQLAARGVELTAIDISPNMVELASRHLDTSDVRFHANSFEDFDAPDDSFDLVVSATAFHWIDPDVAWSKSARLLRSGGWLAQLATGEKYDDPLGADLMNLWIRLSADGGAWAKEKSPTREESFAATALFRAAIDRVHSQRRTVAPSVVLGLEHTRATTLTYDDARRETFTRELQSLLDGSTEIGLVQNTWATMAQLVR